MKNVVLVAILFTGLFSCKTYTSLKKTNQVYFIPVTSETPKQMVAIYRSKGDIQFERIFAFKDKNTGHKKDLKNFSLTKAQINSFIQENPELLLLPKTKAKYINGEAIYFLTNENGEYKLVTACMWAKQSTSPTSEIKPENYYIKTYMSSLSDSFYAMGNFRVVVPTSL